MNTPLLPPATAAYGADEHGLIGGFRFAPGVPPQPSESVGREAGGVVPPASGFVGLHFNLSHSGSVPWLRAHAGLSDASSKRSPTDHDRHGSNATATRCSR